MFYEPRGREITIKDECVRDSLVAHERKACRIHERVLTLVALKEPTPSDSLQFAAHDDDRHARFAYERSIEGCGCSMACASSKAGPCLTDDVVGRYDSLGGLPPQRRCVCVMRIADNLKGDEEARVGEEHRVQPRGP